MAGQRGQRGLVEDLGDEAHLLVHQDAGAVADRDARRFLPAVLQRVQAVVGQLGDILARRPDAEHTAGLSRRPVLGHGLIQATTVRGGHGHSLGHCSGR